jgi:HEAT repeat protein
MVADAQPQVLELARTAADPEMRSKAIEMLGVMGASDALGELYAAEKDPKVRAKLLEAYGLAGDVDAVLRAARGEKDPALRSKAIETLGVFGGDDGARHLVSLYRQEPDRGLRKRIAEALMVNGDGEALIELFRAETDPELKRLLVRQLSLVDDEAAERFFAEILEEKP